MKITSNKYIVVMCRYCSILLLLVAIFISCSKDVKEKNNDLVTVKVDTIQVLDGISTNHYIGTVEASTTSTLICKYSGNEVSKALIILSTLLPKATILLSCLISTEITNAE